MSSKRKMTGRERWELVRVILGREWVLLAVGLLTMGISLSSLMSSNRAERVTGLVLALLTLLAMTLYAWIKLEKDLRTSEMMEKRVHLHNKRVEYREATIRYLVTDDDGDDYEVPPSWYRKLAVGETYEFHFTPHLRVVLAVHRPRLAASRSHIGSALLGDEHERS